MKEMLGGCCVCSDEMGWHDNPLIYCDGPGCEVAVHQGCYGIQEVPEGEWFCERCRESTSYDDSLNKKSPNCELCPLRFGALKRTEHGGWAHVVCALYIPEARFGDVHTMDPVILSEIPPDRFTKICYICMTNGENHMASQGACMGCHKPSCKRTFHVTCAQRKGFLCEEVGVSKTVKYCGFCANHLKKGIQDPSIKSVPACRIPARPTSRTLLSQPTPPSSNNSGHMLVDPIPRPDQVASVLGLSQPVTEDAHLVNNFSPPLTTSSRSSVALDATPPLSHSLHQMKETNGPSTSLNALMNVAMGQNHNRICDVMPGVASPLERNGHMDEKPVVDAAFTMHTVTPSVSRANISKRQREREAVKVVSTDKVKKPRTNNRQSKNMKALLDAVGPVVSETVSDFQRERAAVRSEAERRASHTNTATSTSHEAALAPTQTAQVPSTSAHVLGSSPSTSKESTLPSSMEQLLERQWDQGSQLLMSQAQFDVAQLLTCLHQLKTENHRLEDQYGALTRRREHLLSLNSKLSIPLAQANPPHATHHPPPQPMLGSPHHSPHVPMPTDDSLSQMRSMAARGAAPTAQRPPSQPAQPQVSSFSTPQMHQNAHMRPPTSTPVVSSAALITTPSSQNSTMPSAAAVAGDLANAISPERLVAMNPLASLGGNFLSQQRGLLPGMDHLVTQLLLQQAQQQLRFSQQNASSTAPATSTTPGLFNLGSLIPPINGPGAQNGNPSK